jgi:PAS domain S-box-containing protein
MDVYAKEIAKMGLLDTQANYDETFQFLKLIARLAELLPLNLGAEQICAALVKSVIAETGFENCSILLWDAQQQRLILSAALGLEDVLGWERRSTYNKGLSFSPNEGIAGHVFAGKKPIFIEDAKFQNIPAKTKSIVRPVSLACIPLLEFGVLNVSSRHPRKFNNQTRRNWEMVAKIMGFFIASEWAQANRETISREPPVEKAACSAKAVPVESEPSPGLAADMDLLFDEALYVLPHGICLLNTEGNIVRINKTVETTYGSCAKAMIGCSPAIIFNDPDVFRAVFEKVRRTGQEELADLSLINGEGERFTADVTLVGLGKGEHGMQGFLLVMSDVTRKKAFADKILQTEKLAALGTMAGGVAHDFNNLLMTMLGNVQMLLPQVEDEEVLRRLRNIEKAVHDGAHTVRRLQKFTENTNDHPVGVSSDVNEAIRDVIEMTRPRWKNGMEKLGHTIRFQTDFTSDCFASMQMSSLREILTNLVLNAVEAMPEGGTISAGTKRRKDSVTIQLSDTGIGMPQEVASRIFDPFFTTKGVGNSGLGLSVSWSLVVRCGGEIKVQSQPGKGTTFTLKLPAAGAPPRVVMPEDAALRTSPYRLMVVDDEEDVLTVVRDMLRFKGYRVFATQDAQQAIDLLEKEHFDLLITDLGMPGISGWEVAKKAKSENPALPVILLTGWGTQYEDDDLSERGVDLVLSKPLNWSKLVETVEKLAQSACLEEAGP